MAITLSLAALFGLIVFFLLRSRSLTVGGAFAAGMFGFFLASTGAAGPINHLTATLVNSLPPL